MNFRIVSFNYLYDFFSEINFETFFQTRCVRYDQIVDLFCSVISGPSGLGRYHQIDHIPLICPTNCSENIRILYPILP